MSEMPAKLTSRIPLIQQRMHQAAETLIHRAADSHVSVAQQIAPRDTGLMADTTHKEPGAPTNTDASSYSLNVIAPQIYSGFVEFGVSRSAAQPWFLPSFESAVRQLKDEAKYVTNTILEGGSLPVSVVTISRSGPTRTSPAAGLTRRVK